MKVSPSKKDIILFQECIEAIKQNPFITKEILLKKLKITSDVVKEFLNIPSIIYYISDSHRIQVLSEIADLGLDLYGTKNWASDLNYAPNLTMSYFNKKIDLLYFINDNTLSPKKCKKENITPNITKITANYKNQAPNVVPYAVDNDILKRVLKQYSLKTSFGFKIRQITKKILIKLIPIKSIRKKLGKKYHV